MNALPQSLRSRHVHYALLKSVMLSLLLAPIVQPSPAHSQTGASASFISRYQARVTATQSQQPHWVTPLATVTPRLEQEFRTDFVRQINPKGYSIWNYGNSKGLELILERHTEILVNLPPFIAHAAPNTNDGFGDISFLAKERIFSRNEEHGNAIITAFLEPPSPPEKMATAAAAPSSRPPSQQARESASSPSPPPPAVRFPSPTPSSSATPSRGTTSPSTA